MTDIERLAKWQETELADAVEWYRFLMGDKLTPELEHAFTAGFNHGWRKLRSTLKLHKMAV